MKKNVAAGAVIVAALLALAGCSQSAPEQPAPTDNATESETPVATPSNMATPVAKAPEVTANAAEAITRPEPPAPDTQTQDDADATGMTARVHRDDMPANDASAP